MKRLFHSSSFHKNAVPIPALMLIVLGSLFSITALQVWAAAPPTHKEQSGSLPKSGSIALRSGLEWMNESSDLFQQLKTVVEPLLTAKGLSIMEIPDSTLAPLPAGIGERGGAAKSAGKQQSAKAIKLQSYSEAGGTSSGSSASGASQGLIPPVLFFAQTQLDGAPIMLRGGRIPGRLPLEVKSHDAANIDYVIICRMTAVSPGYISEVETAPHIAVAVNDDLSENANFNGNPDDFVTSAGTVQGVGTLGYGSSTPASPPRSSYGSTPGDFNRGYEGNSPVPGDPWNREADLRARDYQLKNSPPAQVASPPADTGRVAAPPEPAPTPSLPKPPLPGDTDMPAVSPGPAPSRPAQDPSSAKKTLGTSGTFFKGKKPAIAGYALELECYDLKPAKAGKEPKVIWRCTVQQRADQASLSAALPGMLRVAFGKAK